MRPAQQPDLDAVLLVDPLAIMPSLDLWSWQNSRRNLLRMSANHPFRPLPLGPSLGGYLLLAPGVSTVRYPIPQRTFKYVATVQSVTDETCHNRILLVDPTLIGRVEDWRAGLG